LPEPEPDPVEEVVEDVDEEPLAESVDAEEESEDFDVEESLDALPFPARLSVR
jgi:hypothetical protein